MPIAPPHACTTPGCPELVPQGAGGKCPTHEKKRDQARGTSTERGYGSRWRKYRLSFLAANPLCLPCSISGRPGGDGKPAVTPATVCDHIVPHKGDETLFWDPANHQPSCKPHHDARTDEGDFGRPMLHTAAPGSQIR